MFLRHFHTKWPFFVSMQDTFGPNYKAYTSRRHDTMASSSNWDIKQSEKINTGPFSLDCLCEILSNQASCLSCRARTHRHSDRKTKTHIHTLILLPFPPLSLSLSRALYWRSSNKIQAQNSRSDQNTDKTRDRHIIYARLIFRDYVVPGDNIVHLGHRFEEGRGL